MYYDDINKNSRRQNSFCMILDVCSQCSWITSGFYWYCTTCSRPSTGQWRSYQQKSVYRWEICEKIIANNFAAENFYLYHRDTCFNVTNKSPTAFSGCTTVISHFALSWNHLPRGGVKKFLARLRRARYQLNSDYCCLLPCIVSAPQARKKLASSGTYFVFFFLVFSDPGAAQESLQSVLARFCDRCSHG